MSLLWLDGFESYGTSIGSAPSPTGIVGTKYLTTGESSFDVETAYLEGRSLEVLFGSFKTPFINLDDTDDTLIIGFRFRYSGQLPASSPLAYFYSGTDFGGILYLGGSRLIFRDASSNDSDWTLINLKILTSYYIEIKVTNHDTTGSFEVRVNGVNVLSDTGLDTKGSSLTYYNNIKLNASSNTRRFDDFYVCNGAGSVNNDFLGAIKVKELRPGADSTNNFATASPSASHYENVYDEVSDEDTSYNQDSTTGALEMYDYINLSGVNAVIGVVTDARLRTNTGVDEYFQHRVESGSSSENSSNVTTSVTTFQTYTHAFEEDPDTSTAWTVSGVNAAVFGIELQ